MIRYVIGDATQPIGDGPKIIAHICNDAGRWGAGFTGALSKRWPKPEMVYMESVHPCTVDGRYGRFAEPGSVSLAIVEDQPNSSIIVANMVAQHGVRRKNSGKPPILYGLLGRCLDHLGDHVDLRLPGYSIHMPRIGCGLAGGKWDQVEPLIQKHLVGRGIDVTVYDLPGTEFKA